MIKLGLLVYFSLLSVSCIPEHLKKYTDPVSEKPGSTTKPSKAEVESSDSTTSESSPVVQETEGERKSSPFSFFSRIKKTSQPDTIVKSSQLVIFRSSFKTVWDQAVKALLQNYNLTFVDKNLGILTTDWDSYYQGDRLLRNKLTLNIKTMGTDQVEVLIKNSMERYSLSVARLTAQGSSELNGGLWLPDSDNYSETQRIFKNLAILLKLSQPDFEAKILPEGVAHQDSDEKPQKKF